VLPKKKKKKKPNKINRAKWNGGVTEEVEYPLCKYETQCSNPSPTIKRKTHHKTKQSTGASRFTYLFTGVDAASSDQIQPSLTLAVRESTK
jgi:hypothetical protein